MVTDSGETEGQGERRPGLDRDWTQGSIIGNLLRLSWPMVISSVLMTIGPTVDMIWVGKLGTAAMAGVGVAGVAVQVMMMAIMSLLVGMRAMVARFIGAGDTRGANDVAQQALAISAAFSILIAVVGVFFTESILGLFGLEADVVAEGAAYMRIMFVGSVAHCVRMMSDASMQASGDTVTPMRIAVLFRLFHVALCPFLIFGWWLFPRMGVTGAAATNVVSESLGMIIGLWVLFTGRTRLKLTLRNFGLDGNIIWRIFRIGLPALVSSIQRSLVAIVLMWIIAPFGTAAIAAHSVGQRIEMFLFMPGWTFGMAAGVLVGQNLGAGQPERAERSSWLAVGLVEAMMIIGSVAMLVWVESIVRIFNAEPALVLIASTFLRIAVAGYLVMGFMVVFMSALQGAGDTVPPMIISLVTSWAVTLPLAYFLPKVTDLGVYGVCWGMVAGMVVSTIAFTTYFRLGRWKRKRV